ncbi:MAG: hypothetical protein NTAFB01_19140 [Nitrospira sp.]
MHYRSGILIFSRREKLLHANRQALKLTGHLDQVEIGTVCEIHSAPVHELRDAIQAALDHRRAANIWEPFELKRVLFGAKRFGDQPNGGPIEECSMSACMERPDNALGGN